MLVNVKTENRYVGMPLQSQPADEVIDLDNTVCFKRHVVAGDYQQMRGPHSEKRIPTGKLFGVRKFDFIKTSKGIGFVKGKRSSGFFAISDLNGNMIHPSVNIKKNCERLIARTTTLIERKALLATRSRSV